jgi:hypothetical protein
MASKYKLVIVHYGYDICITWFDGDEDGANLGESGTGTERELVVARVRYESALKSKNGAHIEEMRSLLEMAAADHAAKPFAESRGRNGFVFGSQSSALKALRAARAALKNLGAPMPEWALKATAAGWKPPKGWKP